MYEMYFVAAVFLPSKPFTVEKPAQQALLCALSLTPVPAVTGLYVEKLSRKYCCYDDTDDVLESWLIFRVLKGNATFSQNN